MEPEIDLKALEREMQEQVRTAKVEGKMPLRETFKHEEVEPLSENPLYTLFPAKTATYTELSATYQMFSHALMFIYGNLTVDPVQEFIDLNHCGEKIFWIESERPLFTNLFFRMKNGKTNRAWGHRLMGCEKSLWPDLMFHLQTVSGINMDERRFFRVVAQQLDMVDYKMLQKHMYVEPLPRFPVVLFAYDGTDQAISFVPPSRPPHDHINIKRHSPDKETLAFAGPLFEGNMSNLMAPPR